MTTPPSYWDYGRDHSKPCCKARDYAVVCWLGADQPQRKGPPWMKRWPPLSAYMRGPLVAVVCDLAPCQFAGGIVFLTNTEPSAFRPRFP